MNEKKDCFIEQMRSREKRNFIADAQDSYSHQILLDFHVSEQFPACFAIKHLTFMVNPRIAPLREKLRKKE